MADCIIDTSIGFNAHVCRRISASPGYSVSRTWFCASWHKKKKSEKITVKTDFYLMVWLELCVCWTPRNSKVRVITLFRVHEKEWGNHYGKSDNKDFE